MNNIRSVSGKFLLALIGILILAFLLTTSAQSDSASDNYGDTPNEFIPYHHFSEPYKRFFLTPNEYHGYGRTLPEPKQLKEIKIGFLGPIAKTVSAATGGASHEEALGIKMLQGAQLAVTHANEQGGYRGTGIPYSLVVKNDNGLWGASANEIVQLAYKDKVWAILGTIDGANSHIAIRTALKAEISVVNSGDTDPTFTETAIPWAFRNISDDRQMCYLLANYIFKTKGITKVAAFRANNRYGRIGIDEFRDAATRIGHPFIIEVNYRQDDKDFSTQLHTIKQLNPEAIMTYGDAEESAHLLNQIRKVGMDVWFIGSDRIVSEEFIQIVGGNLDKVVAASPFNPDSHADKYIFFKESFIAQYGSEPEIFASHSYDGIFMIIDAIEKAGLNRAKIRDHLAAFKTYDGVSGMKKFDPIFNNLSTPMLAIGKKDRFSIIASEEISGQ